MQEVYRDLQSEKPENWINFQTLNNKMVLFRPASVPSVTFLDEGDDGVCEDDWDLDPDAVEGWPEELYRCLHERASGIAEPTEHSNFSKKLLSLADDIVKKYNLDEQKIMELCDKTRIVGRDGSKTYIFATSEKMAHTFFEFELGIDNVGTQMVRLDDDFGERDIFFSLAQIALIELPLLKLKEGIEKDHAELTETTSA